ncbi:MAG: PorT family protein [Bacteroidetes bacterium]|nr:PorT family protein [Bacteroidota bacterium]MBU1718976.1 PorT family protein [Bacteroidota bacterium]
MRFFVIIAAIVIIPLSASAQFNFGLRAGINANRFISSEEIYKSESTMLGPCGGLFFIFQKKFFSIQPEILYSQKNGEYTYRTIQNSIDTVFHNGVSYLDIPIMFGLHAGRVIKLNFGPVLSFPVGENIYYETGTNKVTISEKIYKNASAGYQVGLTLVFDAISLEARYEQSLGDIDNGFVVPDSDIFITPSLKNSLFQFTLAYRFLTPPDPSLPVSAP